MRDGWRGERVRGQYYGGLQSLRDMGSSFKYRVSSNVKDVYLK